MTSSLNGSPKSRAAIVTGGSRGVGGTMVRHLAASHYGVVVNYLHDQRAAELTVEAILDLQRGRRCHPRRRHRRSGRAEALRRSYRSVRRRRELFVVHTVGSHLIVPPITEASPDEFGELVRLNTHAAFFVNREAGRRVRNGGAIVNLSSSADHSSLRSHGLFVATKAITNVLTQALAIELRERDITVNAVSPAIYRPCVPDRVADIIAYLLSDDGHRLTGQILSADEPGLRPQFPPGIE